MAVIIIDPNKPDPQALREAADIIMQGGIAIYPTETVYGIGVRYDDEAALRRLFDLKGRADNKPVLLLLPCAEDLQRISRNVPPDALLLAQHFWPGPLTLVVPACPDLPALMTGGGNSVGCRVSSNPVAASLTLACGLPITSTSANLSGGPNPSSVADITPDVIARADIVLDAGPTPGTLPSTVYDVSQHPFHLVRPGVIAETDINRALKKT